MGTIQLNTRETVEHMEQDYRASMLSGDITGLVQRFYAKDARVQPNHAPEVVGQEAITAMYEELRKNYGIKAMEFEITGLESEGDVTWVTGAYKLEMQPPGAAAPQEDHGKYIELFRRQPDGSLRCILDAFNSDLPLPA